MRKILYVLSIVLSASIGILALANNSLPTAFMPFAVFIVATLMITNLPGILKGALAQGSIAMGAFLTGIFTGSKPLFIPGLEYFLLSVSIPLGIISVLDFLTFFQTKNK